jgi:rhomboid family GlyGly-CTERM serine protease
MLLLIGLAVYVFGGPAPESLVFDRQAIMQGELWRLLTGHWVHTDIEHLVWNLLALGILGWMIETSLGHLKLYTALITGMCVVNAWVWWFIPSLDYYCGLSGILNTLLFVILIDGWRRSRNYIFPLVVIGATAKIGFELFQSSAIFTNTSWPAVPEAHLAGALAAVLLMFYKNILNTGLTQQKGYEGNKI